MRQITILLLALIIGGPMGVASTQSKRALIRTLQSQGFTGALTGDIHFTTLGNLHCSKTQFRVIYFEWYGPANPGSHRAQYRLLFLEGGSQYVGSYAITNKPLSVRDDAILFGFANDAGNAITCADVEQRKAVLLDGDLQSFFK